MVLSPLAAEKLPKTNNTKWDENITKPAFLIFYAPSYCFNFAYSLLKSVSKNGYTFAIVYSGKCVIVFLKMQSLFLDFHFIWSTHRQKFICHKKVSKSKNMRPILNKRLIYGVQCFPNKNFFFSNSLVFSSAEEQK